MKFFQSNTIVLLSRLKQRLFYSIVVFGLFILFCFAIEFTLRINLPSQEFSKVLFFNQFKLSRWAFLSQRHHQLNVEWVLSVIAQKNADYSEPPEPDRPAFDRIPKPYHIQTNRDGFRDKQFPSQSPPSIILLGDSVGFGKGVAEQERFFSLLKERFPHIPFYNLSLQGCTTDCMATIFAQYVDQLNPKLVILQASSNDIDQVLWRAGVQQEVPDKPIPILFKWHASSYLSQWLQVYIGQSTERNLDRHVVLAENAYRESLLRIHRNAQSKKISIVSLDLPFAYDWNYGKHHLPSCQSNQNCETLSVSIDDMMQAVPSNILEHTTERFDLRTAEELGLPIETIQQVFPAPQFFLDVVHLTAEGHQAVANQLTPIVSPHINSFR